MAALAGLAEDPPEIAHLRKGTRVSDNFLVHEVNEAGCYAVRMVVNGEELIVVVDDWFPFYIDHNGDEKFCFSQSKISEGKGEIWVQILEKAWAKVCGSFEACEMGTAQEAFNNIDGTPCEVFMTAEHETFVQ